MNNEELTTGKKTSRKNKLKEENVNQASDVNIIVKRHQQLFELLNDPHRMWRVLLSLFLIIVVLFIGIAFVVISIKKYYPYNMIRTNLEGASFINSEDKEVIYWLFNTADLWANSGIEVQKGDELTIYASGASFTAIHHLTEASKENKKPHDAWVGTEGQENKNDRDHLRAKFRINKDCDEGTLLMQIVEKDSVNNGNNMNWMELHPNYFRGKHVEIIGKGRSNLRVSEDGVLFFAVNDIVLTDNVLISMYDNWLDTVSMKEENLITEKEKQAIHDGFVNIKDSASYAQFVNNKIIDKVKCMDKKKYKGLELGYYPVIGGDSTLHKMYPLINELVYYKKEKFRDAWYMDNLGSFLIVIERKK